MSPSAILDEINKLPVEKRLLLVEKTLKAIRQVKKQELVQAVNEFYNDYKSNNELTAFTQLDSEPVYEVR